MTQWGFRDLKKNFFLYIDDVLVGTSESMTSQGETITLHFKHVSVLLEAFRKHKMFAKGKKKATVHGNN